MVVQGRELREADTADENAARFLARLTKQRDHLYTFLHHDAAPSTNNQPEPGLRPGCIRPNSQERVHPVTVSAPLSSLVSPMTSRPNRIPGAPRAEVQVWR